MSKDHKRKSNNSVEEWMKFFKEAGIPKEFVTNYAIVFDKHRMRMDMLQELNKDVLHDMGIKTMGDVIAIMRHAKEVVEKETRSKILASSGRRSGSISRSSSGSESPVTPSVRKVKAVEGGPVIIDRRSAVNIPSNDAVIKRSIAGARMAVTTAKHRQELMIHDRLSGRVASSSGLVSSTTPFQIPPMASVSMSTGLISSSIPLSLAKRLGPVEKRPIAISAPGSDPGINWRTVTGLESGDHNLDGQYSTDLPSASTSVKRVIRINSGNGNSSVFNRLGNASGGKITATVKPTGRESAAPYNVHDRIGQQLQISDRLGNVVLDTTRKMVSSNLRVKSDSLPSTNRGPKVVSLKKSVFDRLH